MMRALTGASWLRAPVPLRPLVAAGVATVTAALAAAFLVTYRDWSRWGLAAVIGSSLALLATRRPRLAITIALLLLPFLALLRRLLIEQASWTSEDPLLAVGPILAVTVLAYLWRRERYPIAPDFLSKLVLAVLGLTLLQTLNPNGGGLGAAVKGLIFIGAPLLWFFVGRELGDRRSMVLVVYATVSIAVVVGGYGLWQAQVGMPPWDQGWLDVAGYNSLYVHHGNVFTTRPFGTFSSAAEFATYLGIGLAIAVAFALHRRWYLMLGVPVLITALVFASARTVLVLTVMAILVMIALRTKRPRAALSILAVGVTASVLVLQIVGPTLSTSTTKLGSPLLSHMVDGLAHPLDPNRSTLVLHAELAWNGIRESFEHPLGFGTAATNIASNAPELRGAQRATEIDISNAFVSLGVVGGVLYALVIGTTLHHVSAAYRVARDPLLLAIAGALVVMLGQWLNGGYYAASALIWFLIGYVSAEWKRQSSVGPGQPSAVPAPGS